MNIFIHSSVGTSYDPVCLFLSVTSQCYVKRNEWIILVFGMEAFFHQSYTVF